jgi:NAD(P)-dependent dehydrogenase (short-subunit alcohol dehydrogenase family)
MSPIRRAGDERDALWQDRHHTWRLWSLRSRRGEVLVVGVHLAKRHHPAHLVEAAVETFVGLDALLFMACATAPPLESMDVDAWERSLDVNVRGFIYCLAAALPAMRERGGGRVVVAGVEDAGGMPDPLLRAWRAAVRKILEELPRGFSSEGIQTAEVRLDCRRSQDPKRPRSR